MDYKYGEFSNEQIDIFLLDLHKKIHRLLYFKENNYEHLDEYIVDLLYEVNGATSLFFNCKYFVELMIVLENIKLELKSKDFNFKRYRKFVLDAHGLVDKLKVGD